jgi:integrase
LPLPHSGFPDKKKTIPDPYTEAEFNAMVDKATYDEALLIYMFITTGARAQEIAHMEREDINWNLGELHIVKKRRLGVVGKTDATRRTVLLDADFVCRVVIETAQYAPFPIDGPLY